MTELKDIIRLMESPDYKDDLRAEYYQLCIRISKLKNQINKYYLDCFDCPIQAKVETLTQQLSTMNSYKHALETRAKEEGIIF